MKNFVFDLYGTLVDIHTDENSKKFRKSVSEYFNNPNFWEDYIRLCAEAETGEEYCEINLSAVFKALLNGADEASVAKAARYFRNKSRSRLKVYRGVYALLRSLNKGGARLYILSNAQACFTRDELEKLKLTKYFDGIVISSEFGKKKPAKQFFLHAVEKYGLNLQETLYVGNDFHSDILGAKSAGLSAAYINSNLSPATDDLAEISKVANFATGSFKKLAAYLISVL